MDTLGPLEHYFREEISCWRQLVILNSNCNHYHIPTIEKDYWQHDFYNCSSWVLLTSYQRYNRRRYEQTVGIDRGNNVYY